jgi:hypothetical protein
VVIASHLELFTRQGKRGGGDIKGTCLGSKYSQVKTLNDMSMMWRQLPTLMSSRFKKKLPLNIFGQNYFLMPNWKNS